MKLTRNGIKEREAWKKAGIDLPGYDVEAVTEKAKKEPGWVHLGIGNIFRVFIGGIADGLLEEGVLDKGITCVETFDYDVVDKIYEPYDNLGLNVILHGDGTREYKVLGALAEAVKAQSSDAEQWNRLKEIFAAKSLQMVSFTITEKGYALQKADGTWFPFVEADIKNGPDKATGAMAVLVAMLNERYKAGKYPIALVSMDNCSQNGAKLRESVLTMTEEWHKAGFVDDGFVDYVTDDKVVAFPWTMIDKITPRPSEQIAADLENLGVEDMQPVITGKKTYIAPFVNAEKPQYLVIEDSFPNGRPALEKGFGVYMADRNTVNLSERMKVTVCLNPVHSASDALIAEYHKYPALPPVFDFMDNEAPAKVRKMKPVWTEDGYILFWTAPKYKEEMNRAVQYVVYRFNDKEKVNIDDPSHIVAITRDNFYKLPYEDGKTKYRYVVTALDRLHNESKSVGKKIKL